MHSCTPEDMVSGCIAEKRPTPGNRADEFADMEKRLGEMTFISRFMAATSASLIPQDICAIAARNLYDFIPYSSIIFSLSPDFDVEPLIFSPGKRDGSNCQITRENVAPDRFREFQIDERLLGVISITSDSGQKGVDMVLPEKMGKVRVIFDAARIDVLPALFSEIAGHFSRALKNALAHEKVKELASKDGLTGVFNRRVFDELLAVEMKRKELKPISLLLIDLDDFKKINDNYGHPAGDQVLATVGKILKEGCRGSDLVARYGGEEFAVMLPTTASSVAFDIAQRLRSRIAGTVFVFDGKSVKLTASIGIAQATHRCSDSVDQLVSRADQALYRAKKNGKNMTYIYTSKSVEISNKPAARGSQMAWLRTA
ncbi:GGDEF domain-containing protein [Geobacter pelophilus]|uniref:diguanylate cyclase n=1 Tax=Geoanaerobacter pelophilus TaxID=60036 RepID=A0AAW4KZ57_9BACT|nr:GGDEF domain-containing protein [Geoanaerobacter pelophilus]MBT0664054.1 GGDEF domain-containing protein [Geoanaerobacter pelophilus]